MCQDTRLQDNPDLPVIRTDAADGAPVTDGTVTDALVAGTENSRNVEGSAHQPQLTEALSEIHAEKVMDFLCQQSLTGVPTQPILTQEYYRSVPGTQNRSRSEHGRSHSRSPGHCQSKHSAPSRTTDRDRSPGRSPIERISSITYYSRRFQCDKFRYPRCPDQSIQDLNTGERRDILEIQIPPQGDQSLFLI